jgi:formyltetrahydrofolate-dependent phosphoribosylglycinamide formyltransferase
MRLIVLISGSGTNLQAIIDAIVGGHLDAEIALVVSNRKSAYGLQRAAAADIPTLYFPFKPYRDAGKSRDLYDADLADQIAAHAPDLIVLAAAFLDRFPGQVINLHPALPGTFPGTDGIRCTYEAYQRGEVQHGGCMIHYVIPEVDAGDVIVKEIVPIEPGDTLDRFEQRIHRAEHRIIVEAIRLIAGTESAK